MNNIRRTDVRFNLSLDEDRRAWEYLHSARGKRNRLIIQAINAYAEETDRNAWQETFLEKIDQGIRNAVRETLEQAAPTMQPAVSGEPDQQENNDTIFGFLDSFNL